MWGVNGEYAFLAEKLGATVVKGVDVFGPTPEFEDKKKERNSSVEFILGDITSADTIKRVGIVDIVFCAGVLYHHPSPFDLLVALRRICKKTLILRTSAIPEIKGLPMRYVLLAVPTLIICYSSWQLYGSPVTRKIIQWCLFIIMLLLLFQNTRKGFFWRNWYLEGTDAVLQDIKKGVPRSELVTRHQKFLLHWDRDMLTNGMQQLKQAGMGPLKFMKEDSIR